MGFAVRAVKGLKDRFMAKYGEKIVSNLADTSSDAPTRFAEPKRDIYDELERSGALGEKKADR